MSSPWEAVAAERMDALHPKLVEYFGEIPEGSVGAGAGVFDVVGTRKVWLWPVLAILGRQGVVFPGFRRNVPFVVRNHPLVDAYGRTAILAFRRFDFRGGERRMVDAITAEPRGLVDYLGDQRRWVARLALAVVDGELRLRSTSIAVRFGRFEFPIPSRWSPTVSLVERFDDASGRQRVSLSIDSPQFGRLYEYSGSFAYAVVSRS